MDIALVKLMSAEEKLCEDMSRLSKEVLMVDNDVRAALKIGNRLAVSIYPFFRLFFFCKADFHDNSGYGYY